MHGRKDWLGQISFLVVVIHTGVNLARRSNGLCVPATNVAIIDDSICPLAVFLIVKLCFICENGFHTLHLAWG
jgi:hypothetical protein